MSDNKKYLAFKLRTKTLDELQEILEEHKKELAALRVKKVVSGTQTQISKIGVVRKTIARILTVINLKKRDAIKTAFQSRQSIKQYNAANNTSYSVNKVPKELRPRLTRALRRKLTKHQTAKRLPKQIKREIAFPQRSFALKA